MTPEQIELELAQEERARWLQEARGCAYVLARQFGTVTINDVRTHCPPPDWADPRILGSVFKTPDFTRIGYRPSKRRSCHGRPIGIFALRSEPA